MVVADEEGAALVFKTGSELGAVSGTAGKSPVVVAVSEIISGVVDAASGNRTAPGVVEADCSVKSGVITGDTSGSASTVLEVNSLESLMASAIQLSVTSEVAFLFRRMVNPFSVRFVMTKLMS